MIKKITILGAGIAGISSAYHAKKLGIEATCYEARAEIGGLVSNFTVQGFRFDNAIHLSFTKNDYIRSLFDKTDYYVHKPDAFCLDKGVWLKHPVQNNLYPLSLEEKIACIVSFTKRPNNPPKNFKEWLYGQYGEYIAEKYPIPYTKKYWGLDASELSLSWIGDRIRRAELEEILAGSLESRDENHYYANEMRYPKQGGYFSFIKDIADSIDIKTNKKVVEINVETKNIYFEDGEIIEYERLISTLPLPLICRLIKNIPDEVSFAGQSLLWTTVDLISVGFNKLTIPPYLWFYIYDETNLAARGYSPSLKSPDNAPKGCSSLQFEIYNLSNKKKLDPNKLIQNIKEKILEMGICKQEDILFLHHKHLPFGNVVFDTGMEARRDIVRQFLLKCDIVSCGRFGEWDYLWSDQSFMSGMNAIDKIMAKDASDVDHYYTNT